MNDWPDYDQVWLATVRRFKEESGEDGADITRIFQTHDAWVELYNDSTTKPPLVLAEIAKAYAGIMELYREGVRQWDRVHNVLGALREENGLSDLEREMLNVIPRDIQPPSETAGLTVISPPATQWRTALLDILKAHREEGVGSRTIDIFKVVMAFPRLMREVASFAREAAILRMLAGKIVSRGYPEHLNYWEELTPEEREDVGRPGRPLGKYSAKPSLEEAKGLILEMLEEGSPYLDDRGPNQAAIIAGLLEKTSCSDSTAYRRTVEVLNMPDVVAKFQK